MYLNTLSENIEERLHIISKHASRTYTGMFVCIDSQPVTQLLHIFRLSSLDHIRKHYIQNAQLFIGLQPFTAEELITYIMQLDPGTAPWLYLISTCLVRYESHSEQKQNIGICHRFCYTVTCDRGKSFTSRALFSITLLLSS